MTDATVATPTAGADIAPVDTSDLEDWGEEIFEGLMEAGDLADIVEIAGDSAGTLDAALVMDEGTVAEVIATNDVPATLIITPGQQDEDGDGQGGSDDETLEVTAIIVLDEDGEPTEADDPNASEIVMVNVTGTDGEAGADGDGAPTVTTTVLVADGPDNLGEGMFGTDSTVGEVTIADVAAAETATMALDPAEHIAMVVRDLLIGAQGGLLGGGGLALAHALTGRSALGTLQTGQQNEMLQVAANVWTKVEAPARDVENSLFQTHHGLAGENDLMSRFVTTIAGRAGQSIQAPEPDDRNGLELAAAAIRMSPIPAMVTMMQEIPADQNRSEVLATALTGLAPDRGANVWQALDARVSSQVTQAVASRLSDVLSNLAPVASSRVLSTTSQGVAYGNGLDMFNDDESHMPRKLRGVAQDDDPVLDNIG